MTAITGIAKVPAGLQLDEDETPGEVGVKDLAALPWGGDGEFRYVADNAGDITHDNTRRAGFAMPALLTYGMGYREPSNESAESVLTDMLGDVLHLCDALGLNFDHLLKRAHRDYTEETYGV